MANQNEVAVASASALYYAEEDAYGKPDWVYGAAELEVAERANLGALALKVLSSSGGGLVADDWIAVFTGDFQGTLQLVQVAGIATAGNITTITLNSKTPLSYSVKKGDHVREVTDFKVSNIRAVRGMVSANMALERASIADESVAAASGRRVRSGSRPGGISGDGGSFVVQPGIKGFADLLRHAIGARVYYNDLEIAPLRETSIDGAVAAGATSITVASGTGLANGDVLLIARGTDTEEVVTITAAPSGNDLTVSALANAQLDNATVEKLSGLLAAAVAVGDSTFRVDTAGIANTFAAGDRVKIGRGDNAELVVVASKAQTTVTISGSFKRPHADDTEFVKVPTGPITHEFRKGGELPDSATVYQWHSDLQELWIITGVKISSIAFSGDNTDSSLKNTFNTIAKAGQQISKLPFDASGIASDHDFFTNLEIGLTKNGDRQIGIESATVNIDNETSSEREMGSPVISAAASGTGIVSADYTYQLLTAESFKAGLLGTTDDYGILVEYDDPEGQGESIEFMFPNSTVTGNTIPEITAGALKPDARIESGIDNEKESDLIVKIKSDEVF